MLDIGTHCSDTVGLGNIQSYSVIPGIDPDMGGDSALCCLYIPLKLMFLILHYILIMLHKNSCYTISYYRC
jgi:hypothetical protein